MSSPRLHVLNVFVEIFEFLPCWAEGLDANTTRAGRALIPSQRHGVCFSHNTENPNNYVSSHIPKDHTIFYQGTTLIYYTYELK